MVTNKFSHCMTSFLLFFFFLFLSAESLPQGLQQSSPVYLNVTEEGGVKRWNLASQTQYIINYIAQEGAIVLDGRNGPLPRSWSISVELPSLSSPAFIDIYSLSGNDGVLTIVVPSQEAQEVYTVFLRNDLDKRSGSIVIRGLRVRVTNLEHLIVSSKSICQVNVDGNPGGADIVVDAPQNTTAVVSQLSASFLSLRSSVSVPLLRSVSALLVVTGVSSSLSVDASSGASSATLREGCLSFSPNPVTSVLSTWFTDKLKSFNISLSTAQRCTVFAQGTSKVDLIVPTFEVFDLQSQPGITQLSVRASQSLILDESQSSSPWSSAILRGSTFQLNNLRLDIIDMPNQVLIKIPQQGNNNLTIWCNQTRHPIPWIIGDTLSLNKITWEGRNCRGSADIDSHLLSNIAFLGTSEVSATVQLTRSYEGTGAQYGRQITMSKNSLYISLTQTRLLSASKVIGTGVLWGLPSEATNLTFILKEDVPYDIRVDGSLKIKPIIDVAANTLTTFEMPYASSIKILAKSLSYQKSDKMLKPQDVLDLPSAAKSAAVISTLPCFTPSSGCSLRRWVMVDAHGGTPCMTSEELSYCNSNTLLVLRTSQSFSCNSNSSFSMIGTGIKVTNSELEQQEDDYDWVKIFISFYFFVALICTGFGWIMSGTAIEAGWMALVITAASAKCGTENNNDIDLTTMAIEERSSEVVMNLFTGWYCESSTSAPITIGQVVWIVSGVTATILIVIDAWRKTEGMFNSAAAERMTSRTSRMAKYIRRAVATLMIWLLLPMIYHHLDTDFGSVLIGFSVGSGICLIIYVSCEIYLSLRLGREGKDPVAISVLNGIQISLTVLTALLLSILSRPDVTSSCHSIYSISLLHLIFVSLICSLLHVILMIHWWVPKWSLVLWVWRLSLKARGLTEDQLSEPLPLNIEMERIWRTSSIITFCNRSTSALATIFGIVFTCSSYSSSSSSSRGLRVATFLLWLLVPFSITVITWLCIRQMKKPKKAKKVVLEHPNEGDDVSLIGGKGLMSGLNQSVPTAFNYDKDISLDSVSGRGTNHNNTRLPAASSIAFVQEERSSKRDLARPDLLTSVNRNF